MLHPKCGVPNATKWIILCLASTQWPIWHGRPYQEFRTKTTGRVLGSLSHSSSLTTARWWSIETDVFENLYVKTTLLPRNIPPTVFCLSLYWAYYLSAKKINTMSPFRYIFSICFSFTKKLITFYYSCVYLIQIHDKDRTKNIQPFTFWEQQQ